MLTGNVLVMFIIVSWHTDWILRLRGVILMTILRITEFIVFKIFLSCNEFFCRILTL